MTPSESLDRLLRWRTGARINTVHACDARDLLAQVPDKVIDAVIADAMYGTRITEYDWGVDPAQRDPVKHWAYHEPYYQECRRVLRPGGFLAWAQSHLYYRHFGRWFGAHRQWPLARRFIRGRTLSGHVWIVQTKEQQPIPFPDRDGLIVCRDQSALYCLHPCVKPVEEMRFLVEALTEPGDIVLDCFCGLGATLVAAQQLGRRWLGCDLSPNYCRIALQRLAGVTPHLDQ